MEPSALSFPQLTEARREIAAVVARVSGGPDAARLLDVNPNLSEQIARNTRWDSMPAVPASELYTGVLYDALDLGSLGAAARRRATRRVLVFSPLYGVLRLNDRVAPYRVGICARLPGLDPVHRYWRVPLGPVLDQAARGLVVDCRSGSYAGMWTPHGELAERWIHVRVPGASHWAKHTRGLVTRMLCESAADPRRPEELLDLLAGRFEAAVDPPERAGRPWTLSVRAPG